ncbi:hypothetical protein GCM10023238_22670 [Streptomyces heliomycini]
MVTRERGLELLGHTPGGPAGRRPIGAGPGSAGLCCWRALRWNAPHGLLRCLWVEGADPEALPGLVGRTGVRV